MIRLLIYCPIKLYSAILLAILFFDSVIVFILLLNIIGFVQLTKFL